MFNFDKPGRGVEKNAPEKRGFFVFFDIVIRKFWRIVSLSLFFTLFAIPAFVIDFFLAIFLQNFLSPIRDPAFITHMSVYLTLLAVSVIGAGPASAGQAYVLRNFAREEHAWVWDDFRTNMRDNLAKSIGIYILDLVLVTILLTAIRFYLYGGASLPIPPFLSALFGCFAVIALAIYIMMHFFFYPLAVTLDMGFFELLRTSARLVIMKLPQCIGILLLTLITFGVFIALYFVNVGFIVLFAVLGFSLISFVYIYYATGVMDICIDRNNRKEY